MAHRKLFSILFAAAGILIVDLHFFLPGTQTPAVVRGYGAVYTDDDLIFGEPQPLPASSP